MNGLPPPRTLLVDTDGGVDDVLALMLLLRCPDLARPTAITITAGNTTRDQALANVRRSLAAMSLYASGPSADLSSLVLSLGAERPLIRPPFYATDIHGHDGLGGIESRRNDDGLPTYPEAAIAPSDVPAPEMILQCAERHAGELTLVALGPLTNVALAFRRDPRRFRLLREIVVMGGAFRHEGNTTPRAEFNIHVDPEAAAETLAAGVPVIMVPLDCSEQTRLRAGETQGPGPVHCFVRDITAHIMAFHRRTEGFHGSFHHDPMAMGVALDRSLASGVSAHVAVETRGEHTTGETVAALRPNRPRPDRPHNATVMLNADAARFERFFLERVLPSGA